MCPTSKVRAVALLGIFCAITTAPKPAFGEVQYFGGEEFATDHIFIYAQQDAPEMALAEKLGFRPAPNRNTHQGQGTAGAYVYFENFGIELIWIDDAEAARENVARLRSDANERAAWRHDPRISPYGIGLYDRDGGTHDALSSFPYYAPYLEEGEYFSMLTDTLNIELPFTFFGPPRPPPLTRMGANELAFLDHPNGAQRLTGMRLTLPPGAKTSDNLRVLEADGLLEITEGEAWHMELTFDSHRAGKTADFRPALPLEIEY